MTRNPNSLSNETEPRRIDGETLQPGEDPRPRKGLTSGEDMEQQGAADEEKMGDEMGGANIGLAESGQSSVPDPAFVSQQVTEARRFYLDLKPNLEKDLVVVCGGMERMRPDYIINRADFSYYAIEVVAEGEGELIIGDKQHSLATGSVFAYGPNVPHTIRTHNEKLMRKYFVDFVGKDVPELLIEAGLCNAEMKAWSAKRVGGVHELTSILEMLIREVSGDSDLTRSICSTLLRLMLLKVQKQHLPEHGELSRSFSTYQRIRSHIEQNCLSVNTIEEIAKQCEVTPVYLSRLFKRYADCGAYQFLLRLKMNHAAGLLLNEKMMVRDVSEQLGFADPFQFSRAFKRVYGVPPKQLIDARR